MPLQSRSRRYVGLIIALVLGLCGPLAAQEEVELPEVEAEEDEGTALEPEPWSGRFDLGYTWQSGRTDKNELSLRGEAERSVRRDEYRAIAEFLYGTVDGTRNTHRYDGSFRWRRSLSERTFTQSLTRYESDRIRDLRHRVEQNVGIGYRFLKTDRMEGSVVPGVTGQYTDEPGVSDKWDYFASLFQDFEWEMTDEYRFEQDLNLMLDPSDTDNYIIRLNAGIVGVVTQNINLSVRYRLLFENQTPPDVEKSDHQLVTSIGYAF